MGMQWADGDFSLVRPWAQDPASCNWILTQETVR